MSNHVGASHAMDDLSKLRGIVLVMTLLLFGAATLLASLGKAAAIVTAVYGAGTVGLIFTFLPLFKSFKALGVEAELREIKEDVDLIQTIAFAGIVSKYEIKHLIGIDGSSPYVVRYSADLKAELKRLDDFGFTRPNDGMGLDTIDRTFGVDLGKYESRDKTPFDLKEYIHITDYGRKYVELATKLGLPERA